MDKNSLESFLTSYFEEKRKENHRFSLRALAMKLEMEPSFVSKILRRKYKLNERIIQHICRRLQVSAELEKHFIEANESHLRSLKSCKLEGSVFSKIASWEAISILRFLDIDGVLSVASLARQLGISEEKVNAHIKNLEEAKLIEKVADSQYRRLKDHYFIGDGNEDSYSAKKLEKEYIAKALESLEKNPVEERTHTTILVSIREETYQVIQAKIHQFIMEIARSAKADSGHEEKVMMLNLNFFPVLKNDKEAA